MSASREDISGWFDEGVKQGATHMLVICDQFDWDDFPVYIPEGFDAKKTADARNGQNMERVMECYNLRMDKDAQLKQTRAFNY